MFDMFSEEEKVPCVFVELTPTKQIIAAPLCCWVGNDLHLSVHIMMALFDFHSIQWLTNWPIDWSVLLLLLLFEYEWCETSKSDNNRVRKGILYPLYWKTLNMVFLYRKHVSTGPGIITCFSNKPDLLANKSNLLD